MVEVICDYSHLLPCLLHTDHHHHTTALITAVCGVVASSSVDGASFCWMDTNLYDEQPVSFFYSSSLCFVFLFNMKEAKLRRKYVLLLCVCLVMRKQAHAIFCSSAENL